jgi:hypothetical protein
MAQSAGAAGRDRIVDAGSVSTAGTVTGKTARAVSFSGMTGGRGVAYR